MHSPQAPGKKALKSSLQIYLLAGGTSVLCAAAAVGAFFTWPVEADVRLPRPAATLPPAAPALLAPSRPSKPDFLHGLATWYGAAFHGRKTASGKPFNMYEMTACHPTLPFGTMVRVKNLRNNHSVVVQITDRGYLFQGRVIDLSYAAAEELNMTKSGVAPVALEVLALGASHRRK